MLVEIPALKKRSVRPAASAPDLAQTTSSTTTQSIAVHLSSIISIPHSHLTFLLLHACRRRFLSHPRARCCSCAHCQLFGIARPAPLCSVRQLPLQTKPHLRSLPDQDSFVCFRWCWAVPVCSKAPSTASTGTNHTNPAHQYTPTSPRRLLSPACLLKTTCGTAIKAGSAAAPPHTKSQHNPYTRFYTRLLPSSQRQFSVVRSQHLNSPQFVPRAFSSLYCGHTRHRNSTHTDNTLFLQAETKRSIVLDDS